MAKTLMQKRPGRVSRAPKLPQYGVDPVDELIEYRAGEIQRMEYEGLGRMLQIQTKAGWIEFRRNMGPTIGRLSDGIDLIDPWPELKDRIAVTSELCPDCLAPCDECGATGFRLCTLCGGAGKTKAAEEACECVKAAGAFDPGCKICKGLGSVPRLIECTRCVKSADNKNGWLMKCPECQGTTRMSTGHKGGALPTRNGEVCATCEGYGKELKRAPQDLTQHIIQMDGAAYLGPILGFLIKPIGEEREPQPWKCSADGQQRELFIVSKTNFARGTRAAVVGGIAVPQRFNT